MTTLPLALGQEIHSRAREIAVAFQHGRALPDREQLLARTRDRLNFLWVASTTRRADFMARPCATPMLHEVYYGLGISESQFEVMRARMEVCVDALLFSPVWDALQEQGPAAVLLVEPRAPLLVERIRLYAAPDLVYWDRDRWVVVDWKTGSAGPAERQLSIYALYVQEVVGPPLRPLPWLGRVVLLARDQEIQLALGRGEIEAARRHMRESVLDMSGFVAAGDLNRNDPLTRDLFSLAENRRGCPRCPFFELCEPEL